MVLGMLLLVGAVLGGDDMRKVIEEGNRYVVQIDTMLEKAGMLGRAAGPRN